MKKLSKIIGITLIIALISICISPMTNVYAASSVLNVIDDVDSNIVEPDGENVTGLSSMAGRILGIIQIASAVIAVVLIAIFGFKFIMGSAEEKSEYMKSFIPLIIGVVVVFAASSIATLIFNVAGQ